MNGLPSGLRRPLNEGNLKLLFKTGKAFSVHGGEGLLKSGSVLAFPLIILLLFFIFPVLAIFRYISPAVFIENLGDSYIHSVIGFTFLQAAVSTVAAVLLGLPGAWIMSHVKFRGKRIVSSITTVPFVLPSILVVLGFVLCFGNSGILNTALMRVTGSETPPLRLLYSFKAIILAHAFYNFPIPLRLAATAWRQIGKNRIEAAEILGAGRLRIFFTVILPALTPAVIASASLVFIFCFMSFAVILVLGGGPEYSTLEVEIYRLARVGLDLDAAASLALAGAILTTLFTWAYIRLQKKATPPAGNWSPVEPVSFGKLSAVERILSLLYLAVILMLIIGPLAAVIARSFQQRSGWAGNPVFSFAQYGILLTDTGILSSVFRSAGIAFAATLIALPAGFAAAYSVVRRRLKHASLTETFFMMPMGVSAVVIGLGYYSILSILPEGLQNQGLLIIFAHSVIALPFVVRTLTGGLRSVKPALLEASATLGAGFFRTLVRIELPLLKGSLVSAAAFAFCISAGEINAVLILSDGSTATMPIVIYRLISSYRFFTACALGTVLMIVCGVAFYLIDRYGGDEIF